MIEKSHSKIALALAFFLGFTALSFAQNPTPSQSSEIKNIISDQLSAFLSGDGERAYSHAAPGIKKIFPTVEMFMTMVERGYGPIYRSTTYDFGRSTINDDQFFQELILTDQRGNTWQSIYSLMKQPDGAWKIMGVQMRPSKNSIL